MINFGQVQRLLIRQAQGSILFFEIAQNKIEP